MKNLKRSLSLLLCLALVAGFAVMPSLAAEGAFSATSTNGLTISFSYDTDDLASDVYLATGTTAADIISAKKVTFAASAGVATGSVTADAAGDYYLLGFRSGNTTTIRGTSSKFTVTSGGNNNPGSGGKVLADLETAQEFADWFGYDLIDPSAQQVITSTNGDSKTNITINFTTEKIYWAGAAPDTTPAFVSFDAGGKWSALKFSIGDSAAEGADFSKFLNKSSTVWLTTELGEDKKPKAAVKADAAKGIEAEPAATVWKFTKYDDRQVLPKLSVFYPFDSNDPAGSGVWTLSEDGTKAAAAKTLSAMQIVYTTDGKNPAGGETATYGVFDLASMPEVKAPADPAKPEKYSFLVRVAATSKAAGSKAKKLTVSSLTKAPALKIDYKKGLIKMKGDMVWGIATVAYDEDNNPTTVATNLTTSLKAPLKKDSAECKTGLALVGKTWNYYGTDLGARIVATGKKPASAIQAISVADYSDVYEVDVSLTIKGVSIKLPKEYEACKLSDSTKAETKWSGSIKAEKSGQYAVRLKNSAKYDAKKNATSGNVTSGNLILDVIVAKDSKGKDAVTATAFLAASGTFTTDSAAASISVYPAKAADTVATIAIKTAAEGTKAVAATNAAATVALADLVVGTDADLTTASVNAGATLAGTTLTYEFDATAIDEATEIVAAFESTSAAKIPGTSDDLKEKFYAPEFKLTVTPDNKGIVSSHKTAFTAAIATLTSVSGAANKDAAQTALDTLVGTAKTAATAMGCTVVATVDSFTAPTATTDGSYSFTLTITRGDEEADLSKSDVKIAKTGA